MREDIILPPVRLPSPSDLVKEEVGTPFWPFFVLLVITISAALGIYGFHMTTAPQDTPQEVLLTIPEGSSIREIGEILRSNEVIRSPRLFSYLIQQSGRERSLDAGVFLFKTPMSLFAVVDQLASRAHGISTIKITLREGLTNKQMGEMFSKNLSQFDKQMFLDETKKDEGYLFPDTYFFYANATTGPVIAELRRNFESKTAALHAESDAAKKKWDDIITMASIIEEEAVTDEDRRIVSGILWDRIGRGMRLQVDASFAYLFDKSSAELSVDDLAYDSPYNTYKYAGLPPTPIANPGLAAIDAALHPIKTGYLYYLSDSEGVMHYAKTFDEHKRNKAKYLR